MRGLLAVLLLYSAAVSADSVFSCEADKRTVVVVRDKTGQLVYLAWNNPKSIGDEPDLTLKGGEEKNEGTGPCNYTHWTFKNGQTEYDVGGLGCTEEEPPKGTVGQLFVTSNGDQLVKAWCRPSKEMAVMDAAAKGIEILGATKTPLAEYIADKGKLPTKLADVVPTSTDAGTLSMEADGTVVFKWSHPSALAGKTIKIWSADDGRTWTCGRGTLEKKYRPSACRN